jgi:hypothetical protein
MQQGAPDPVGCQKKFWDRPVVAPLQEMSDPDPGDNPTDATTRTEAQRCLEMLDCVVGLPSPVPQHPTDMPGPRGIRVKRAQLTLEARSLKSAQRRLLRM